MKLCRVCNTPLIKFLDLGMQPIANNFLYESDFDGEYSYHLNVGFCPLCHSVQLINVPDKRSIFNECYPFFTSTSKYMENHFCKLANIIKSKHLEDDDPFILEIGCNDGTFLKNFNLYRRLGVDPSLSVAEKCWNKGIDTLVGFFDEDSSETIFKDYGQADVIVSANVFPHIEDRLSVLKGIKTLLKPKGVWINEEPYLKSIIHKVAYDQFYNEHIYYSSIESFRNHILLEDLELQDVEFLPVHGGSYRYFITHKNNRTKEWYDKIVHLINRENLDNIDVFKDFAYAVYRSKENLLDILRVTKGEIVGYAATAKSSTILNYCNIGPDKISRIYDTTPEKQDKFSPGKHIPIVSYDQFGKDNPKNVVLFAWNHAEEIFEKEQDKSINWIIPI